MGKKNFNWHVQVVKNCGNEAELHSNWFTVLAADYFDLTIGELQHERRGPKGIVDVRIMKKGRCQLAIELKRPGQEEPLENAFQQAHRYAFSFNFYKDGRIVYPLGILTNGKKAIIFDGSIEYPMAKAGKIVFDLTDEGGFSKFTKILDKVSNGEFAHSLQRAPYIDTRPEGILDKTLQKEFQDILKQIISVVDENILAFDYWVQLFLIAVLRDCGIIPNDKLKDLEKNGNILGVTKELNRLLNENFIPLNNEWNGLMWEIYGHTKKLCTRLDLLHADTLGYAYESVLKIIYGKEISSTSIYTPEDLAIEMIRKLKPTTEDVIIDTAAGSGTLLCVASEIAWESMENIDQRKLESFFSNNLIAIDCDKYALSCCKAMLLSTYVKILDTDPSELGANWRLPRLKGMNHENLFNCTVNKKVTLAIGNPPWGNIDAPKDRVRANKYRDLFQNTYRSIYSDDSDISIYVLRHMLDERIFHWGQNPRMGLLIKQQVLHNKSHENFRIWAKKENFKFIDHRSVKRFPHSPASLVAECFWGEMLKNKDFITTPLGVSHSNTSNSGLPIGKFIISAKGFEPSKKRVYIELAKRIKKTSDKRMWVKKVYPNARNLRTLLWDKSDSKDIMFVPRGTTFPKSIVKLTIEEEQLLASRSQVAAAFPYSWRGCEKLEKYGEQLKNLRYFMPREPASKDRLKFSLDMNGCSSGIGTSGHSIWLKKPEVPDDLFLCLGAWMASKQFMLQVALLHKDLRKYIKD